jgi:hypothetical protein
MKNADISYYEELDSFFWMAGDFSWSLRDPLRIRDVYPGSRILILSIPDPKTATRRVKKICSTFL